MATAASKFESLELRGVGRSFGGQNALVDLDLTVRAGEFIALLGPSGCGKSTALNCLAGLLPLTHGQILVDGERVDTVAAEHRDFAMVFQNYALFPHLTVEKNVAFGLERKKVDRGEVKRRVAEELERVGLAGEARRRPSQLSGGQQQRVALARALVNRPAVLLLDEPLSALDALTRSKLQDEFALISEAEKKTIILITNDVDEAILLADRVIPLTPGPAAELPALAPTVVGAPEAGAAGSQLSVSPAAPAQ